MFVIEKCRPVEEIKFRRKVEFALQKRNLLKTGGGSAPDIKIQSHPELDSCEVDIEIEDMINCDTVKLIDNNTPQQT